MVAPAQGWEQFQQMSPQQQEGGDEAPPPPQAKSHSWGDFQTPSTYQGKPDPTEGENGFETIARNIYSNVARAKEAAGGSLGDLEKFIRKGIAKYPGIGGGVTKAIETLMGKERFQKMLTGEKGDFTFLPTTEQGRQMEEKITGQYTRPRTSKEAAFQRVSSDVGASVPYGAGGAHLPAARTLINVLGIPAAANAAHDVVKGLGFDETKATYAKLATWTALSLINNVSAPRFAADLMNEGRAGYGPNVAANVNRYGNGLNHASRDFLQGDPRAAAAMQQVNGVRNDIATGQTTMCDLMRRYDAINAAKRDRGLFDLSRGDRRAAIRNINLVRDAVRAEIEHVGRINPQALHSWQEGVQAFAAIHRSNFISNTVGRLMNNKMLAYPVSALFLGGAGTALKASPLIAGTALAGAGIGAKAIQVGMRVWGDATLARYYWQAMAAAAAENGPVFIKNLEQLNSAYEKKYGKPSSPKKTERASTQLQR